jgi:hypothetical protein
MVDGMSHAGKMRQELKSIYLPYPACIRLEWCAFHTGIVTLTSVLARISSILKSASGLIILIWLRNELLRAS